MSVAASLLLLFTAAEPACDRACLVAAASACRPAKGTLDLADLAHIAELAKMTMKGTTAVEIKKGPRDACTVLLSVHLDELSNATKEQLRTANGDVRNRLQCEGTPETLARLLEVVGTEAVTAQHLMPCFTTKCDPLPRLAAGCKAGPCSRGGYDVTCGKTVCKMNGQPKQMDRPTFEGPVEYSCGEKGIITVNAVKQR